MFFSFPKDQLKLFTPSNKSPLCIQRIQIELEEIKQFLYNLLK